MYVQKQFTKFFSDKKLNNLAKAWSSPPFQNINFPNLTLIKKKIKLSSYKGNSDGFSYKVK